MTRKPKAKAREETREKMRPITRDQFTRILSKAIKTPSSLGNSLLKSRALYRSSFGMLQVKLDGEFDPWQA
jgi:hypothetical protein